jgi:hypothetical protein
MNEKFNAEPFRQQLNRSAAQLEQPTLARLRDAREQALAHYDARCSAPDYVAAGFWSSFMHTSGTQRNSHYYWAAFVLLAVFLFSSATYWQQEIEHDNSEVDIAILTDDLPIDVYVD